jgi:hypothetical protein
VQRKRRRADCSHPCNRAAAVADVDDLLVDAHREGRLGVAEAVHRSAGWQVDLGQDQAKVRRSVCSVQRAI